MTKDTGGQAFPLLFTHATTKEGMTLRDYFAAKALQGFLADPEPFDDLGEGIAMTYARQAYIYADAMLKAREQ